MNPSDVAVSRPQVIAMTNDAAQAVADKPPVRIKELAERDRRSILMHFLGLGDRDRMLRFGSMLSDELITKYVQKLDFSRDAVFGVYDDRLMLVGIGHLAFAPRDSRGSSADVTVKERIAEFGVSVLEGARGLGIGSKLFRRAAIHCRNEDVDTLYMQCLVSNQTMIHIAQKAGMEIHRELGETDAYLKLTPASPRSVMREAVEEQVATFDYAMKANAVIASRLLGKLSGFKPK
jgi:GNAT superfamily N-acetyltransferase